MRRRLPILAILLWASSRSSAEPVAENGTAFTGVLVSSGQTIICLTTADTSRWVELGQQFGDYRVANYDARTETVELNKAGVATRLRLKNPSKVQAGTVDARRALWEKVQGLDGLELVRELVAGAKDEPPGNPLLGAVVYLNQQYERVQTESTTRKREFDRLTAETNSSDEHHLAVSSAQQSLANANTANTAIRDRLIQTATEAKKTLHDSLSSR